MGTEAERRRVAPFLSAHHVDGVLLISSHRGQRGKVSYVTADDRDGAKDMVRYLVESGRKRIATIAGPQDSPGGVERLAGYREVLAGCDVARGDRLVTIGDCSWAGGESGMEQLLTRVPNLDAVFVASDLIAGGALAALERAGRRVPGDVAVGGFDDSPAASSAHPPLTTIRQPWDRICETMVRRLLAQIEGEGPATVILPTELVARESA